jgi:two-component system cell cycle sensor histidine kinase/response regulator CckA
MAQILIVESHASSREYLRSVLERLGHQVTEAQNDEEGLEFARLGPPAIVFIDILMPTMDGYEFVSALRSQPEQSALPVVFWTAAYLKREALGLAQECGVHHIADKSALPEEISWIVEQCLGEDAISAAPARDETVIPQHPRIAHVTATQRADDLQTCNRRLSALSELGRAIANQDNVPSLLKEVCEGARYLLGARVAFAFTIDPHSKRVNFTHLTGTSMPVLPEAIDKVCLLWQENLTATKRIDRVDADHGVMAHAFQAALPRCIKPYLGAAMLNPIGGMVGALVLGTKIGVPDFDEEDTLIASAVAAQAGVAYQNWARRADLQESLTELQAEIALRRKAESELHNVEEDYESSIRTAPYGIYRADPDGKLLVVNKVMAEMLGYDSEREVVELQTTEEIFCEQDERQRLIARYGARDLVMNVEVKWKQKGGAHVNVKLNGWPKLGQDGKLIWYEVFVENVTAHRKIELQVQQAQRMDAVGQFAGGVAHDFNNLLMIISGYADLIQTADFEKNAVIERVGHIARAAKQAAAVTKQLLAFSRTQPEQSGNVDLSSLLEELEDVIPRLAGEHIRCSIKCAPSPRRLRIDRSEIEQVLLNLVVNARDAMPDGGKLTIETAHVDVDESHVQQQCAHLIPGPYARITVSDTGIGMDEATKARLFEPFFTTKQRGLGTGLGLSMVSGIVKRSGGDTWVYSFPGKGSTFTVYLPVVEDPSETKELRSQSETIPTGSETILLVAHEQGLRTAVCEFLRSTGYVVLEASNGMEALHMCGDYQERIDVLLTDYIMPGLSGPGLGGLAIKQRPTLRIICMSGYTGRITQIPGSCKTITFLQKPFSLSVLAQTVRDVLTDYQRYSASAEISQTGGACGS